MKKTITLLLLLTLALFAADFRFYTDHASFYDKENPYVELYYMLPRQALKWESAGDNAMQGKFLLAANIYRDGESVYSRTVAVEDRCAEGDTIYSYEYIPEQLGLHLAPGNYELHTMVRDFHSGNISEDRRDIRVRDFGEEGLQISDIVIASYAGRTEKKNKFTRPGNFDIIPMANPEFDKDNGRFYTYFEIYRLEPGGIYATRSCIRELNGDIVKQNEAAEAVAPGEFDIVIDHMDIRDLPPGTYEYGITVHDKSSGETARAAKRLYMVGPADMDALLYDEGESWTSEELDSMFQVLRPLMTRQEIRSYRRSGLKGRQKFFREFWARRDSDMSTEVNEYYMEIRDRIRYAEKHFTYLNKGARSDRGRVLLKYGYPSEIQRSSFTSGEKDHEVWHYEGMRGEVIFVFCDVRGRGYYELIHSNMEGEIHNADWKAIIQGGAKNY